MQYKQQEPELELSKYIKFFWQIEDSSIEEKVPDKIIPDGFTEFIFHYKAPYKIKSNGLWRMQSKYLMSGQITNHFYLKNTGEIGMFGIKFEPTALAVLFSIEMETLTEKVIPIQGSLLKLLSFVIKVSTSNDTFKNKVTQIEAWFSSFLKEKVNEENKIQSIVTLIVERNGSVSIKEIIDSFAINERTLERHFKKQVGLSPKLYCRIIRFAYIFKVVSDTQNWSDVTYQTGFYDQSHFINNFKEFTGEDPSKYGFNEKTMANFFLRK